LSGAYLAKVKNAPLLLVNRNNTEKTIKYIEENLRPGNSTIVYLLGESDVVPETVRLRLKKTFNVKRLAGEDRFATNLAILKEARVDNQEILVCSGYGFADSLSASATGRPILLVGKTLTSEQIEYLKSIRSRNYTLIGDNGPVSNAVESSLKNLGTTARIYGDDRYETSVAVAKHFFKNPEAVVIGYGDNFPDGLCGGILAEKRKAPLLLINPRNTGFARQYVKDNSIKESIVLGDEILISDTIINSITQYN